MHRIASEVQITVIQHQAIEAMLSARSITAAAQLVNVDRTTIWRWLKTDSNFQAAFADAQRQLIDQGVNRIIGLLDSSIDTVDELRKASTPADSVRLKAALSFIEIGAKVHENAVLGLQLEKLSRLVEDSE